ncbi:DUF7426 family protein [Williamsia soli]|uniref:DUF7426 family protein n=1 Tax=Williamsia soli TaxID=364929 RepID=UPI001A9E45F2|nr:hypothetical protein [Williamsia soli]
MFDQFDEWLDSGLILPIGGREFRVEPPSALTILRLHSLLADKEQRWTSTTERVEIERVLGGTWTEMVDAGVPELKALHAGRVAITHFTDSAANALATWKFQPIADRITTPEQAPKRKPTIWLVDTTDPMAEDPPGTINEMDPGGGPYRPEFGDRLWYRPAKDAPAYQPPKKDDDLDIQWSDILDAWDAVCVDFHMHPWNIDLSSGVLDERPWQWLAVRLQVILGEPNSRSRRTIEARKAVPGGDTV